MTRAAVHDIRVTYTTRRSQTLAIDGVTLAINAERVALLGPNGSGKSTLMGVLAGTIVPDSGRVEREGAIGMVFQTPALDALLTVRENLTIAGRLHAMAAGEIRRRIDTLGGQLGLGAFMDKQVRHLSGGQARRADLARAMVPDPALLLLDEPSAGLDPDARRTLMDALTRAGGASVVLSTHLTEEADRCDRVVLMSRGRVVLDGEPGALRGALGEAVLHVHGARDDVLAWCAREELEHQRAGAGVLIARADADLIARCPIGSLGVTLRPPTLEDVYLWHTHASLESAEHGDAA